MDVYYPGVTNLGHVVSQQVVVATNHVRLLPKIINSQLQVAFQNVFRYAVAVRVPPLSPVQFFGNRRCAGSSHLFRDQFFRSSVRTQFLNLYLTSHSFSSVIDSSRACWYL